MEVIASMIIDISYTCSNCEKTVIGVGVFLSSNGIQEGFCSFNCAYEWLGKQFHAKKQRLEKKTIPKMVRLEKRSEKIARTQAPTCSVQGEG
jgi:wyosine [tRNA(Phe)-imidazoG37] synthetase (radical SAM superfamily)